VLRIVLMRAEYGVNIKQSVREIAITLVREPGQQQDVIKPKRMGIGITFETVSLSFPNPCTSPQSSNGHPSTQFQTGPVQTSYKILMHTRKTPETNFNLLPQVTCDHSLSHTCSPTLSFSLRPHSRSWAAESRRQFSCSQNTYPQLSS
jgi:hypothetical protein